MGGKEEKPLKNKEKTFIFQEGLINNEKVAHIRPKSAKGGWGSRGMSTKINS